MPERFRIRLGFLPTRRNIFDPQTALAYKEAILRYIRGCDAEIVTIDALNAEGMLFDVVDAPAAAKLLVAAGADAVFAPHCNFGTEDAVAKACALVGKPVLLWGPRDEGPDREGFRLRDSQCGLFATSKALLRYGVPFSYITNSALESDAFARGLRDFLAVACVVKCFGRARIGQIGVRPERFVSVCVNESELLEKFGIEIAPMSVVELFQRAGDIRRGNDPEHRAAVEALGAGFTNESSNADAFETAAAFRLAIERWAREREVSAVALQCWNAFQIKNPFYPCFINALVTGGGLPVACETDVLGALTQLMLMAASRGGTPFLADVTIRHPQKQNVELLWHCGNFPPAVAEAGEKRVVNHGRHASGLAGAWKARNGPVTLAKVGGLDGKYSLLIGGAQSVDGPHVAGTYLWARFNNWPRWERRLIYGPYIHHIGVVHGRCAPILYEACRYIPHLTPDPIDPTREMLEDYFLYAQKEGLL